MTNLTLQNKSSPKNFVDNSDIQRCDLCAGFLDTIPITVSSLYNHFISPNLFLRLDILKLHVPIQKKYVLGSYRGAIVDISQAFLFLEIAPLLPVYHILP